MYPRDKNPFSDDKESDFNYGRTGRSGLSSSSGNRYNSNYVYDDEPSDFEKPKSRLDILEEQKQLSIDRQADMTRSALSSIYDSERMGIATAEELVHQGEQLDNIERKTSAINQDMKTTQKHLNSIKSVFGGIKNWWHGKKPNDDTPKPEEEKKPSRLQNAIERDRNTGPHPGLRIRSEDCRGFYDEDNSGSSAYDSARYGQSQMSVRQDDVIDKNLDLMSDGMARLKDLALGLGDEIERQNEQIEDRIMPNIDRANVTLDDQNKQMQKILR